MGKTSEFYIDYVENVSRYTPIDLDKLINSDEFEYEIHRKLCSESTEELPMLREFLHDIFPRPLGFRNWKRERLYIMAQLDRFNKVHVAYDTADELYDACCKLCKEEMHFFFIPLYFNDWRDDKGACATFALVIDIDHVENCDFQTMSEEEIINLLVSTYSVPMELLPQWAVVSGHGIHLYYLIEELDLSKKESLMLRRRYLESMTLYFKGDVACMNPSHIFRVPYSKNIKDLSNIKQTKLYRLSTSTDRSLSRLDYFLCAEEEFKAYRKAQYNRTESKRKATMETNNTSRGRKKTTKESVNVEQAMSDILCKIAPEWFTHTEIKYNIDDKISRGNINDLYCNYSKMPSNSRYSRVLRDLHNYAARRFGVPVGFRDKFVFIYATYAKLCRYTLDRCYSEVKQYVESDFYEEALLVVQKVYAYNHTYSMSLYQVSRLLEFTQHDIDHSFCIYADEETARLERHRRYDAKRYEVQRSERAERLAKRKEAVKGLMHNHTEREIAAILGMSNATVHRVIKQIKEEESTLKTLPRFIDNQWEE